MTGLSKHRQMSWALVWTNLLNEPLFTLYNWLPVILCKDFGASVLQLSLLTTLKPVVTILSFYWSAGLNGRAGRLKANVLWAGFLMRAPFLLCPWIDSVWFMIAAAANYMFFYRAGTPAWMEIIKRNMNKEGGRAFSISSALGYVEAMILGVGIASLLDKDPMFWKELLLGAAIVGLISLAVQSRIVVEGEDRVVERPTLKELVVRPWRDSYQLIKERPEFSRFQWGLMVFGFGIMLIQPAIILFMVNELGVSYLEIAGAISIAKSLGTAVSLPVWARWMDRMNVLKMSGLVYLFIGMFPVLLSLSMGNIVWLYVAFFLYGVGQGGSHLVWSLSGPIFAGKEDSSRYTGVNVAMAGLRGIVAPPLGGWLTGICGPIQVLTMGGALCFYSGIRMLQSKFAKDPLLIKE